LEIFKESYRGGRVKYQLIISLLQEVNKSLARIIQLLEFIVGEMKKKD